MRNVLDMPIASPRPMERRRHPRTQLKMKLSGVRLDPDGGDVLETLHMLDISRSGMGAICGRPFYPGQRIVLCLPLSPKRGRRNIYATAVRCRQNEAGYHVGLEFDSVSQYSWCSGGTLAAAA